MPSPFPGMDPYLEHPVLWPGIHQGLITFTWMEINARLAPRYVANIGERLYVVESERSIYPDTLVIKRPGSQTPAPPGNGAAGPAAVATADPPWQVAVEPVEVREVFVQIVHASDPGQVVTVLEVLSPANKAVGDEGRTRYVARQREVLHSRTHLVEIDLLRRGKHTVAVPRPALQAHGKWDYLVSLHRAGQGRCFDVWPATVQKRLPRIRVPLAGEDPDFVLDLQDLFTRCYDAGAYAARLDYRRPANAPLKGEAARWADALLRGKGLR